MIIANGNPLNLLGLRLLLMEKIMIHSLIISVLVPNASVVFYLIICFVMNMENILLSNTLNYIILSQHLPNKIRWTC